MDKITEVNNASSNTKRIAKNTLMLYFRQILIMLVSLYTVRVVLNVLGAEDYGIYNVVAGVVTMFTFLNSALAAASQRYFSYYLGKKDDKRLSDFFSLSLTIYIMIAIIIILLAETLGLWFINKKLIIPAERSIAAKFVYHFSVISIFFSMITAPYMAEIISHEDMNIYATISIIEVFIKLGSVFLLKYINYDKLIIYGLLMSLIVVINTSIYRIVCKVKYQECKFKFYWNKEDFKEMFSYVGWSIFGSVTPIIKNQAINILINQFYTPIVNAARSISLQVNTAVSSFSRNFSTALRPQIIKDYASEEYEKMFSLIFHGCKYTYYLMWIITCPLLIGMDFILTFWLKNVPDYTVSFTKLALIDALMESITYPIMTANQATGRIKYYQIIVGIILFLNLPISFIAMKMGFNPNSIMIIAVIISFVTVVARIIIVQFQIKFNYIIFFKKVCCPIFIVTGLSYLLSIFIIKLLHIYYVNSIIDILMALVFVIISIFFIGLNKDEKQLIFSMIKTKIGKRNL